LATVLSNFAHLREIDPQLLRLGLLAERYFPADPNTSLLKLRQLAELLAQQAASRVGIYASGADSQLDLLHRLRDQGVLSREVGDYFHELRRAGNAAMHGLAGDHRGALSALKIAWQLGVWFHRSFRDAGFKPGAFVPPKSPPDESAELREELATLRGKLQTYEAANAEAARELEATLGKLREAASDQAVWEQLAAEAESAKAALERRLEEQQRAALARPRIEIERLKEAAFAAPVELDEAATRQLIDRQLEAAGWQADTVRLSYGRGARPQKGRNLAIAEWPTESGKADYVLFTGLSPLAAVEAKRKNLDVSGSQQQAKRYSRGFATAGSAAEPHPRSWGEHGELRLPFVFSANGRPFLRQLREKSGIWFCDLRRPDNLAHALEGFYTPDGLQDLLKRDFDQAHRELERDPFEYGFPLRDYQQQAIRAAEAAIAEGRREMLLAMATGTGKTKTCIALVYRLLKARRFRRVLFLVDRKALGEQAADAFKETRMESLQTFADTFGILEIGDRSPESATAVHIATVQSMVRRLVDPPDHLLPPPVDAYDCIVVDECHRGYLLDRELSENELAFRDFADYVSKYRRVLDYFAAVKIGLTATPALHTTQIFGLPIFSYSYREAVVDGFLADHEPPIQIETELSRHGIHWEVGEKVSVYDPASQQLRLFQTPDQIDLEIDEFNRKVITRAFNQVVCRKLAEELDPASRQKTLIFCVLDSHADMVVELLKEAFAEVWGTVDDDAVLKITGSADDPLQLIRRFKNERNPNVAVTVDLLTTGIDVPAICNLVFLRRVNSRILFDQMLGRATRKCDEVGKEAFRIFDAVRIYEELQDFTEIKPVVVDPKISFAQLIEELQKLPEESDRERVREQLVVKLSRKLRHLSPAAEGAVEAACGLAPLELLERLRRGSLGEIAALLAAAPGLGELLDRKAEAPPQSILVSEHADRLVSAERGYGQGRKPEDYLQAFAAFVGGRGNEIPALVTVLTRPRELTRKDLRELALALDGAGFSEKNLATAWREATSQEIAARIVGFIRQAAIGDPLLPYEERVERALRKTLASRPWSGPQRAWLQKIAAQTKANGIVDRAALEDPELIFGREGGGFARLDRLFEGRLEEVVGDFNEALWQPAA
jgi:type I restriction enzyme R subunit